MTTGLKVSDNATISDEFRDVDAANPFRQIDGGTDLGGVIGAAAAKIGAGNPSAPAPSMTGPQIANGLAGK